MDLFAKNLKYLKQAFPALLKLIEQADPSRYVLDTAKNGDPTFSVYNDDNVLIQIHSKYNPRTEGARVVSAIDINNKEVVIVIGLGLGYHVRELVNRKKSYTSILVVEKDPGIFSLFLKFNDYEELYKENVRFIIGEQADTAASMMSELWWQMTTGKYEVVQYLPLTDIKVQSSREYYAELFDSIKRHLNYYILNQNTIIWHTREMQEHIWENISGIVTHHGVNSLYGKGKGIPAIVVAAGPSLDKQIAWLKKAKNRALIICVDTALKTLLAQGIKPDIAVAVDYSQLNYKKIEGIDPTGYYMAVLPAVVPGFFELFKDDMFIYYNNDQFYNWLGANIGTKGLLPSGGSVSHSAFQIAKEMECDPIIFVGLDLAYTGGTTHSSGGMYDGETIDAFKKESLVEIEAADGSTIYTSRAMWAMVMAFEHMFAQSKNRIIDATEGGAVVPGSELMPFTQVYDEFLQKEQPINEVLKSHIGKAVEYDKQKILSAVGEMTDEMVSVLELAASGEKISNRIMKQMKKKAYDKDKVVKYLNDVKKVYADIYSKQNLSELIDNILLGFTRQHATNQKLFDKGDKVKRKDIADDAKALKTFFTGINEACAWYRDQFESARERLEREL